MDFQLLINAAKQKLGFRQLSQFAEAGSVAAALATADGQILYGDLYFIPAVPWAFAPNKLRLRKSSPMGSSGCYRWLQSIRQVSRSHLVAVAVNSSASWILPIRTRKS